MKKVRLLIFSAVAAAMLWVCACERETPARPNTVSDMSHTDCLSYTDHMSKGYFHTDSVRIEVHGSSLFVTHYNIGVSCDFTKIEVQVSFVGDTIYVDETSDGGRANCLCEADDSFHINNLRPGIYTVIFNDCIPEPIVEVVEV